MEVTLSCTDFGWGIGFQSMAWAGTKEEPKWECINMASNCRSYLVCAWNYLHRNKKYKKDLNVAIFLEDDFSKYTKIGIFMGAGQYDKKGISGSTMKQVEKNLPKLHAIEDEAGVARTELLCINNKEKNLYGILCIPDKAWYSTMWKISLYSFFVKMLVEDHFEDAPDEGYKYSDGHYQELFRKNKKKLLEKVKDFNEEVVTGETYEDIHCNTGFVTLCERKKNKVMTKLLLGEKE
jgi:hypothetical protein